MSTSSISARSLMMEPEVIPEKKFVRAVLPWLVAAGALVFYLGTLNHWVSFNSLLPVAKVSGWTWQPELYAPLYWLVTSPLRWLPARVIPLALNLFSAVCGALTLALLARSVALLPHDRTDAQRQKVRSPSGILTAGSAWLPPVLAAIVCGLQLTFWENATAASGGSFPLASNETFDLLLFAYIIRNLLEFRLDQRETWLIRASLVCGASMTNNWAMIGFFPLFIAALVWMRGLSFFNARFLTQMALWGLAGLSLYFLLPLWGSHGDIAPVPFWPALRANLHAQENILLGLFNFLKYSKQQALLLGVTSLLPVLVISIRWASYFGDTSRLGVGLTTFIFHVVHALFLLSCIWVALDPPLSPRNQSLGIPFLTLSYLGALSVGYCSGYFLIIFGGKPTVTWPRSVAFARFVNFTVSGLICLLLLLTPAALLYRNLPQIRTTNGPMLKQYAALLAQGLPAKGAVVLSDDSGRSLLMRSAMTQSGQGMDNMFVDTVALQFPAYNRFLKKKYPQRWPIAPPKERLQPYDDLEKLNLIALLARSNSVYYLQPSFGYYFESFYLEPHGLVYRLQTYPTNALFTPLLSKDLLAENDAFWTKAEDQALQPLLKVVAPPPPTTNDPGLAEQLMHLARLKPVPNRDATVLAGFYSRALDYWGVELQRADQWAKAAAQFDRAQQLNPDNLVAKLNLECNRRHQAGSNTFVQLSKSAEDEFGKYSSWDEIMGINGPFDEPRFCFKQGRLYVGNALYRQAAHMFDRVRALVTNNLPARLWLAQLYVLKQMPDQALPLIREIQAAQVDTPGITPTNLTELLVVESSAHLALNDLPGAESAVAAALMKHPKDVELVGRATQVYLNYGRYSNALAMLERQLQLLPDDPNTLVNKGYVCIQLGNYTQAVPPLSKAVALETNHSSEVYNTALLNLAIAYLKSDQLEAAQTNYETLQKAFPTAFRVYYGLGEIAYRKKDTNAAIRNYQLYLANARTNSDEARIVLERLKELKPTPPAPTQASDGKGKDVKPQ